jgi:flavin-binding protein dodecin
MAVSRVTEITASSKKGLEAAVEEGLRKASRTLKGITALEVAAIKARVEKGRIAEYRVTLKVSFVPES